MNVSLSAQKKQPSAAPSVNTTAPVTPQSEIEVLLPSETAAVAGGPQVKNDPQV